ncbi:MAG: hypothetical protein WAW17_07245 [Rhodococcus sp. (in: high G+C Gram-positive bacteria)]|uniref:hypothetical protein n=1 Tax=Rhodococcus sp. TaxID=1831 RepID=UPI003BB0F5C5
MTNPETMQSVPPDAGEGPALAGGSWKPITDAALSGGHLEVDPEGIRRCIKMCDEHANAMAELADRAKHELWVEALGIGEKYLQSAQLLTQKYNDKAIGGGQIAFESSAFGLFRAHESYAQDMKSTFEAVLHAYEQQEGVTTSNLGSVGGVL